MDTSDSHYEASGSTMQYTPKKESLYSLGYYFDGDGVLRDKDNKKYVFVDQESYEKIGLAVTEEIYRMMENVPYCMTKKYLGEDKEKNAFIFVSRDWDEKEHLIVLINGSGAVRAGQWSRRLIMNESLDMGSQLPYLRHCGRRRWGVIVMNTNMNFYKSDGSEKPFPGSSTPIEHGITAWKTYVAKAKASSIAVIAHSAGGLVIAGIMENCWSKEMEKKVKCICLTDAMFTLPSVAHMKRVPAIRNWIVSAHAKAGRPVEGNGRREYVRYVSSGTAKHDETSASAMQNVFSFIENYFL